MSDRLLLRPVAKTADYAVEFQSMRGGALFTNRGAVGAVTFTLPTLTNQPDAMGIWAEFVGVADQTFTVAAAAGKAVCVNNAAATSLACSTGNQKIGARIRAVWDGTSWILSGCSVGITYTVA